ncbi:MAG: DUF3313 domain-containing protein [Bryobacter sp.]|jgi:hypothetical protein|nr:DUF3313 domain-containing protein [Bryobacter sp.]
MSIRNRNLLAITAALLLGCAACSKPTESTAGVKKMKAGQEYAGFLKDYTKLAPNAAVGGNVKTFVQADAQKNLRHYIAVVVDPVDVYLASDADDAKLPEKSRAAAANYFRAALTKALSDAFPVVDQPGPLVLRLRAAVIGIDAGAAVAAAEKSGDAGEAIEHAVNIGKVGVEMELLDSVSGEQIAAMVDREPLGEGAEIGAANISRHEKSLAARAAFDEWAGRVRTFINRAHELNEEDARRARESYQPYGAPAGGK